MAAPESGLPSARARRFPAGPILRDVSELHQGAIKSETARRLATAKVVTADYELLQADFPRLAEDSLLAEFPELAELDDDERTRAIHAHINAWLVHNAAIVSHQQVEPNTVNSPISLTGERVKVFRPPRYGRALLVPLAGGGLLDIKGAGIQPGVIPSPNVHHSGLMFLGEAIADLAYQRVIDAMLQHSASPHWTLPTYAVLSLGFDVFTTAGKLMPAGMQVRRAHRRPPFGGDLPMRGSLEQRAKFEVEMILRHFGLTSCNSATTITRDLDDQGEVRYRYGDQPVSMFQPDELRAIDPYLDQAHQRFEGVNVQLIRDLQQDPLSAQIVDFGHFEARERFELPVVSLVLDRVMRWGGSLNPDDPHYVQPDPALALPWAQWGRWTRSRDPEIEPLPGSIRHSYVDRLGFELALGFVRGEISEATIGEQLERLIADTRAGWPSPTREA